LAEASPFLLKDLIIGGGDEWLIICLYIPSGKLVIGDARSLDMKL
jgi:hypothetical protein